MNPSLARGSEALATRASLAFPPLTGGVELYEGMIAFWTEASHALAHAMLPKTQVLERNLRTHTHRHKEAHL